MTAPSLRPSQRSRYDGSHRGSNPGPADALGAPEGPGEAPNVHPPHFVGAVTTAAHSIHACGMILPPLPAARVPGDGEADCQELEGARRGAGGAGVVVAHPPPTVDPAGTHLRRCGA